MTQTHNAVDIIIAKRDKGQMSGEQIDWIIDAYTNGGVADEQMSALLMAILLNGMTREETINWTDAMIASGQKMNYTNLARPSVDKHSTGGVGDKITLPLAPIVAACGAAVPQLSGRGLGHTGGTLDKLESIKGWRSELGNREILDILNTSGAVICAPSAYLARADKKLYALRDVTGTVESIPLIASSIMSKKIAEGAQALVLDVKCGSGAFMKNVDQARELAHIMVELGTAAGVDTSAYITAMDVPLGKSAGNALEVAESIETLQGGGSADVRELTLTLARRMLQSVGLDTIDPQDVLDDGRAMDAWNKMITAQGGDISAPLAKAKEQHTLIAPHDGWITRLDAMGVGIAAWRLGAGRSRKEDTVQAAAGVQWHVEQGQQVRKGRPLATLHTDTPEKIPTALEALEAAIQIGEQKHIAQRLPLIIDHIGA